MKTMAEIKESHAQLYEEYISRRQEILQAPTEFESRASTLLDEMCQASAQVTSVEEYDWLRSAVDKWRSVYVLTLNVARDISLQPPTQTLLRSARQEETVWSEAALNRWVQSWAFEAAKHRAVRRLHALTPEELLMNMPSTKEEEQQDWRDANAQLAYQVLDGRIKLDQIRPESYWRLEQCWLEDMKRIKAFYIWIDRGATMNTHEHALDNYYEGCRQIRDRLWGGTKLDASAFSAVSDYLESQYFKNGKLDAEKCGSLIASKARHLWETTGESDSDKNWYISTDYVRIFYTNIIPAITDSRALDAHGRITREMREAMERCHLVVNVFEIAVARFFLAEREAGVKAA